ncbi:MAG: glycosyltransferase [Crocinitomicaceae bacterium]|nr:glycosyltransferase [Crocinitomicaceae bacterium]
MPLISEINLEQYLILGLVIGCFIQVFYCFFFFLRLCFYSQKKEAKKEDTPVSIIICARNEAENLLKNLPSVLNQLHKNFEVIVVNHDSTDKTENVLRNFQKNYTHLNTLHCKNNKKGKKELITLAIKSAKYEHLIFTDADCVPNSSNWAKNISDSFSSNKNIIIGYGPNHKKSGLLNYFFRFDTAITGITYLSYALGKQAYMGVGRNMSYTKTLFKLLNGFDSHKEISSGDDDLFIQDANNKTEIEINIDPDTYCFSNAKTSLKSWVKQKKRHQSASIKYKVIHKGLLGIYSISLFLMWVSFVSLLIEEKYQAINLSLFCFALTIKWGIQGGALLKLKERSFVILFPLIELFQAFAINLVFCFGSKNKKNKW